MKKELKQAIINFIFDNEKDFQLVNNAVNKFRNYIYDDRGNFLIGGEEIRDFIKKAIDLLTN